MIIIKDIIEIKNAVTAERLSFATRYLVQINFTFDLTAITENFRGKSHFCVRRDQLDKLCSDLIEMKQRLSGKTILEDNDSDTNVNFEIKQNGQLIVYGQVGGTHEDNYLKFNFQTDQTCIEPFVDDFHKLLEYEEPTNLYEVIDLILWKEWDPIGINNIGSRDEYKSYTSTIFNLKNKGVSKTIIAEVLHKIETETMGLLGNYIHCEEIAAKIIELK